MFCYKCGAELTDEAMFCYKCGVKVPSKVVDEDEKEINLSSTVDKQRNDMHPETILQDSVISHEQNVGPIRESDNIKKKHNRMNPSEKKYGDTIKPYYREQFEQIASGEKPKFNWAALFLNGWIQLYHGCTGIFCKTFLPLLIALFMVEMLSLVSILNFNFALLTISLVLGLVVSLGSVVLSIINGFKFNQWYYQDVVNNPGKKRSRKGLWILLISEVTAVMVMAVFSYTYTLKAFSDNFTGEIADNEITDTQVVRENVDLSMTYTNKEAGVSFRYPSGWNILDSSSEFHIVDLVDSNNTAENRAMFGVSVSLLSDPFGVFSKSEDSIREEVNEFNTFLAYEDVMIGDVPAKALIYQTEGLNGDDICIDFYYIVAGETYCVKCSYTAINADTYEPIFDAIMNSYSVDASMTTNTDLTQSDTAGNNAVSVDNICFNDIPVSDLLNSSAVELVQRFGGNYHADGEGGISYDEIEFYMLDDETVGYIWSFSPECFSINGNALNVNDEGVIYSDEIIELLGTAYEDESLSSGYYMTYYYPTFSISFGVNKFSEVSDIRIYNLAIGNSDSSGNVSGAYQEPIENYWKLSGSYSDSTGGLTLSLGIYSSQEEGEIEIGNADIYANNGQHYFGAVTPVEKNVYRVATDTGEEVLLVEEDYGDVIMLQLYVDGQYLDEYQMVEHYVS